MALIERNALRRAEIVCAKIASYLSWLLPRSLKEPPGDVPHVGGLSDRMLRDIGLFPKDIERYRHRFPSQHDHHPRL